MVSIKVITAVTTGSLVEAGGGTRVVMVVVVSGGGGCRRGWRRWQRRVAVAVAIAQVGMMVVVDVAEEVVFVSRINVVEVADVQEAVVVVQ